MRRTFNRVEKYRQTGGEMGTKRGDRFGAFLMRRGGVCLRIIVDDGSETGWEHVSVSLANRVPTWEELCLVKSLFWNDTETVVQFHPAKPFYVNLHPNVLHLWRKVGQNAELPPMDLV